MNKLNIFVKILGAVHITCNAFYASQIKSEDLRYQYNSQENASWENAQYEEITTNVRGERLIIRFFVDKNSNIFEFKRTPNYNFGPTKIGNLTSKSYSTGDTCFFGTNAACRSNITKTTKQFAIEGCKLIKYTRTDMIQFGTKGDINKYVLGSCINSSKKKTFEERKETYVIPYELKAKALKHIENAKNYLLSGKQEEAIKEYSEVLAINPYDYNVFNDRGIIKCDLKQYQSGIKDYDMAIKISPNYSAAFFNRGNCKVMMEHYKDAIPDFDMAIKITPRFPHPYHSRGVAKFELGDIKNACSDWIKASKIKNYQATKPIIKKHCK